MKTIQQATAATSADPKGWTPENPAWGQCAVTALIVQDFLGGKLMRTLVDGKSHYYNIIEGPDGEIHILDLTLRQFPKSAFWGSELPEERTRSYVLGYPETALRYGLLRREMGLPCLP